MHENNALFDEIREFVETAESLHVPTKDGRDVVRMSHPDANLKFVATRLRAIIRKHVGKTRPSRLEKAD